MTVGSLIIQYSILTSTVGFCQTYPYSEITLQEFTCVMGEHIFIDVIMSLKQTLNRHNNNYVFLSDYEGGRVDGEVSTQTCCQNDR